MRNVLGKRDSFGTGKTQRGARRIIPNPVSVVLACLVCALASPMAFGGIWYVNVNNHGGTYNGTSWATAYPYMNLAIQAAAAAGSGEVWVAQGTYYEQVHMKPGINIYGGFAGNETIRNARNWNTRPTIIHGAGPADRDWSCVIGDNATLDGFQITGGHAAEGGGMYNYGVQPTVQNCNFYANIALPRTVDVNGDPLLFHADTANGGAINCWYSSCHLYNCLFFDNSARGDTRASGGAICSTYSQVIMQNCIFKENYAVVGPKGSRESAISNGGGISIYDSSNIYAINCTFYHNYATGGYESLSWGGGSAF